MRQLIIAVMILTASAFSIEQSMDETGSGRMQVLGEDGVVGDLPLQHTSVVIDVSGNLQRATVRQVYGNPYDEVIEAIYTFPLPQSGAVDRMNMYIGDRLIEGKIHERQLAQQIYNEAIEAGQTASLLEQERPNIFTQTVGNILPGDSIVIEISYVAPIEYDDGEYEIVFPMVVGPRFVPSGNFVRRIFDMYEVSTSVEDADRITPPIVPEGTRTGYDIELSVNLNPGVEIQEFESINHEVDMKFDWGGTVTVSLDNDDEIPNRDFVFRYTTASDRIQSGVIAHNGEMGGHFMLILQPDADIDVDEITPKEMFFVVDCSGSMGGQPMEVAKETVRQFVRGMNPDDTFQIMRFSETASSMSRTPLSNTESNIEQGVRYINNMSGTGGTVMIEGVRAAIGYPEDPERMRFVIFLTDGFIGNEAEILSELKNTLGENTRLFSVGVGSSPNRFLIEGLAEEGRGHAYYVGLNEDPDESVAAIYNKINDPYLVGIDIDWGDLDVHDIYPSKIPDLYAGEPLVIVGRYDGSGTETVRLSGTVAGERWGQELSVTLPSHEEANDVIATLWARKKIHDLTRSMYDCYGYLSQDQNIVDEITDTALDYQIMSEYTAFVAVSEEVRTDPDSGEPITVQVPVNMPDGVSYEGIFGSRSEGDRGGMHFARTSNRPVAAQSALGSGGYAVSGAVDACEECVVSEDIDGAYYYGDEYETQWIADVSHISVSPTLGLMPSIVRSAARQLVTDLTEVYQEFVEGIEGEDWPIGTVTFNVTVDGSGNVISVSITGSGLDNDLDDDLCEVLENLNIPAPPDGAGTIQIQYDFQKIW
ncbi:MAG: VIT and VWA domain-containing protein [Candidatus Aegiribacteria sp.]|nr:VIT and VWA domain-containing protein [Candidatus Aegiribacteria sp.]